MSNNGKYFGINRPQKTITNKDPNEYFSVYNSLGELKSEYSFAIPKKNEIDSRMITDNGVLLITLSGTLGLRIKSYENGEFADEIDISKHMGDTRYNTLRQFITEEGNIKIVGLVGPKKDMLGIDIYHINLDDLSVKRTESNEFDKEEIQKIYAAIAEKSVRWNESPSKGQSTFTEYIIENLHEDKDGNSYVVVGRYNDYEDYKERTVYVGKDVLVIKINAEGKHEWSSAVYRNSESRKGSPDLSSYINNEKECLEMLSVDKSESNRNTEYRKINLENGNVMVYNTLPVRYILDEDMVL